jgi:catechol 2,3-dioxygenase-like lactoylglutathione lyase family enzyme
MTGADLAAPHGGRVAFAHAAVLHTTDRDKTNLTTLTNVVLIGINHVALEVGDIDEALAFWESIFGPLELRGRGGRMAFIDMGDQFVALAAGQSRPADGAAHFGLVVDDKEAVRARLRELGIAVFGRGLDFRDPWGNVIQVVDYRDIQFTKAAEIARGMGIDDLEKTESAREELRVKGLA